MRRHQKKGRRGFTLVELIVVVGLMGLLATISIGGYFAASRGMAARGVLQNTASLIRQAMQTSLIDQVPTAVLFLNRRTNKDSEGGEAYGTAIAIKMVGRISYKGNGKKAQGGGNVPGGTMLVDEFADWNQSYPVDASDNENQLSVRLYRMGGSNKGVEDALQGGLTKCSSLMCAWVGYTELRSDYMIATGRQIWQWCDDNKKTAEKNKEATGIGYDNANNYRWGLPFHPKNDGLASSEWNIGDAYGVEIASFDLPKNYIFGTTVPTDVDLTPASSPSVIVINPAKVTGGNVNGYTFSVPEVKISMLNDIAGDNRTVIGEVDDSMLEDQD